jgi:starch phosphorylase
MKVLVNGGLNLSELDGWWAEAFAPELGWALGDGREHGDDPEWDAAEAGALYDLLEREVVPEFYTRDPEGLPTAWIARMRESMARLTPLFSSNRTVREYTEQHYVPAATAFRERADATGALGRQILQWQRALQQGWPGLRFGDVRVETREGQHEFDVKVHLGDIAPDAVRIELYADGIAGDDPVRIAMERLWPLPEDAAGYEYRASVPTTRPATDYTARAVPQFPGVAVPLEVAHILWQR